MQRVGRWTRLKAGLEAEYVRTHRQIWPEMKAAIAAAGIRNYSCYIHGCELFSYFEVEDLAAAWTFLDNSPVAQKWQETMAHLMDVEDAISPWQELEEVFHLD
jgi:L-rhamnose mutarotase